MMGYPVDVIYMDFSKAFDRVPHLRLVRKLHAHGIGRKVADWIEAWLTGRRQRVVLNGVESDWTPVSSGVPQGSVLGPTLFIIYINDIDDGISGTILKFADDTKIIKKVGTVEQAFTMQDNLQKLYEWSLEWQMLFNVQKCKCLHLGYNNPAYDYYIGDERLETVTEEKDLGVNIHQSLSPSKNVARVVKTANQRLGMIRRTYVDKNSNNIMRLYKTLVRPQLEYCVQAWRPYLQKDIDNIESIQRRATKMCSDLRNCEYETRLKKADLMSLEIRRLRADLIEVFKIIHGLEGIDPEELFEFSTAQQRGQVTRGHQYKIVKQRTRLDVRRFFFSQRIIDEWNALPPEAVQATSINKFKSVIDPLCRQRSGLTISQRRLPAPVLMSTDSIYSYVR